MQAPAGGELIMGTTSASILTCHWDGLLLYVLCVSICTVHHGGPHGSTVA